ncbi:DUF998 domain-containing protein [Aeromicrobium sp. YIM 150415]|uniref:DUF998 domain-containing protein n=1 Tax=Aeromicrobium sp. YIM 150415 TaxID=2803912 RepID=UPI001963DB4D|nr:DUF998 domain-containing protein [Aeromicrobium sp. YIM 150415]MBM9463957.1 DUF998 domain-containing protein [Aeromicrobium sp. YIM 150415]
MILVGAVTAAVFPVVFALDGWTRPGYDPRRQPVSALALGPRGRVQTVNFLVAGTGIVMGAVGLAPSQPWPAVAIGIVGCALIASGGWRMDPMRGYPPGTPDTTPDSFSPAHRRHDQAGAIVFGGFPIAAAVTALTGDDLPLRGASLAVTLVSGFLAARFATAWENDAPDAGRWQRLFLWVAFGWLAVIFVVARTA